MAIDKELAEGINLMLKGEEAGFNILYSHTYNYVYGRTRLIMKNEEDALDLTQETYIQAYKGIRSLEDPNNVFAWLGAIAYRQGMLALRKKRDVLVSEESEGVFDIIESTDAELQPEESAEAKATSQVVMDMINELPELQRAAVMAYYYDEMRVEDIATAFDCSAGTIKSRLNYARKFLKEKVMEHEKKNRYKLCSVSPAIIIMAIKALLAKKEYKMAPVAINSIYAAACSAVGLTPSLVAVGVGATAVVGTSAAASATGSVVTAAITKAGMAIGTKIVIAIASVAAVGTIGTAAIMHNKNNNELPTTTPVVVEATTDANDKGAQTGESATKETNNEAQFETSAITGHVHNYTETVTTEATCVGEGVKTFACACGDSYTEAIPATGHNWGEYIYNEDANSIAGGTATARCNGCGAEDTKIVEGTKIEYTYTQVESNNDARFFMKRRADVMSIPGPEGDKIGEFTRGWILNVLSVCNENGWYGVEYYDDYRNCVGYVAPEDVFAVTVTWFEEIGEEVLFSNGKTTIRNMPSLEGEVICEIEKVKIDCVGVCNENGWYAVLYGEGENSCFGYVAPEDVYRRTFTMLYSSELLFTETKVAIRDFPGSEGNIVYNVETGVIVIASAICNENGWYAVDYEEGENHYFGYVAPEAVSKVTFTEVNDDTTLFVRNKTAVRNIPSLMGEKLHEFEAGERINVYAVCNENGWYEVLYNEGYSYYTGYVDKEDVLKASFTYFEEEAIMFVSKKSVVRAIPSEEGEKLAEYSPREMITVGGKCNENGWYRVQYKEGNSYKWGYLNDEDMLEYTFKWLREDMYSTGDSVGRATPSSSGKKVYTAAGKGDLVRVYAVCEEIGWYFVEGYGDGHAEYRCFMAMSDVTSESPWEYREDGFVFYFGEVYEAPYLVDYKTGEPTTYDNVWFEVDEYGRSVACVLYGENSGYYLDAIKEYLDKTYGPMYSAWQPLTTPQGYFCQSFVFAYWIKDGNGTTGIHKGMLLFELIDGYEQPVEPEELEPFPHAVNTIIDDGMDIYFYYNKDDQSQVEELRAQAEKLIRERTNQLLSRDDVSRVKWSGPDNYDVGQYLEGIFYHSGYSIYYVE